MTNKALLNEQSPIERGASPGLTLAAVAVVQFMVSLDLSVVNLGLPEIATSLGFSELGLTWVIHAYALAFGGLLLLGGKIADRYGHKRILLIGLFVFGIASLAGGFAEEPGHLVAARVAQGVGAALLAPAALALLTATFPSGKPRVKAFGVWAAMNAAGGALGVLIGGVLTEYAGWEWVMWVSAPMAAVAAALTWRGIAKDVPVRPDGRPDVLGALLATGGMTLLVLGIVRTDRYAWSSMVTLSTLGAALVLLAAFVYVERNTTRDPLVRVGLLANRSVAGANSYNLIFGATMASAFYFVSLYLQRVLGTSPAETGLKFLPLAIGVVIGSVIAIKLGYKVPARTLMVTGAFVSAVGFAGFGLISADGSFLADVLVPSVIASVGFGLCLGPMVSTATHGVAQHETGTASSLLNSSRQLGAALGLAALSTAAFEYSGKEGTPSALSDGYAFALTLGAGLWIVAAVIALVVLPRVNPATQPAPDDRELVDVPEKAV